MLKYASFAEEAPTSLGTYFPSDGLVMFDEIGRITEVLESLEAEEEEWFISLLEEGKIVHTAKLSFSFDEVNKMLHQRKLYLSLFVRTMPGIIVKKTVTISCKPMQQFHGQMHFLKNEMDRWKAGQFQCISHRGWYMNGWKKCNPFLQDYDMEASLSGEPSEAGGVFIIDGDLSAGFELPFHRIAVITDAELFKGKPKRKSRPQKMSNAERIKSYSEIKPGDYVVHAHHGIGKYIGIENMSQGGIE